MTAVAGRWGGTRRGAIGAGPGARGLDRLLRRVRRRLRVARSAARLQTAAPWISLAALLLVAAARVVWLPWAEPAAIVLAVVAACTVVAMGFVGRIPIVRAAWATDRSLETHDAVATALELGNRADPLALATWERALRTTAGARARRVVRLPVRPRRLAVAAVVGTVALAAALTANPQDARRRDAEERSAALAAAADTVATAAAAPENGDPPDPTLARQLEALAAQVRDAPDLETAERLAERAAIDLAAALTPEVLAKKAALTGLDRVVAFQPLLGFGNIREPEDAATQLAKTAASLGRLSKAELGTLAGRLAQLAEAQRTGNPELAQTLREAGSALQRGDQAAAADALRRASNAQRVAKDAVAGAEQRANASQRLTEAARGLGAARAAEAGRGQPGNGPAGSRTAQGGVGNGRNGSGNGRSEGDGGRNAQTQGAVTGARGGTGSGESGAGVAADGQGGGSDPIFTDMPFEEAKNGRTFNAGQATDQVAVPGSGEDGSGDGGPTGRRAGPVSAGSAVVPAADIVARQQQRATAAMARPDVPPAERAVVARYFDGLARVADAAATENTAGKASDPSPVTAGNRGSGP